MLQFKVAKSCTTSWRCLWWSDQLENLMVLTILNQSAFSELRSQTAQTCRHLTFHGLRSNGPRQLQIASPKTKRLSVQSSWQRINQLTPLAIVLIISSTKSNSAPLKSFIPPYLCYENSLFSLSYFGEKKISQKINRGCVASILSLNSLLTVKTRFYQFENSN